MQEKQTLEQDIVIGLIVNTEYAKIIKPIWNDQYLLSSVGTTLAKWCWRYFDKYKEAPRKEIKRIYETQVLKGKLNEDIAEEIELDILPLLDKKFREKGLSKHLIDLTLEYFQKRSAEILAEDVEGLSAKNKDKEAIALIKKYKEPTLDVADWISIDSRDIKQVYKQAFEAVSDPVLQYKGAWGEFINTELVKGSFVSFLAPEKRGKTWLLMELAISAIKQGKKVAFFQAGDMTAEQQIMRVGVNVSAKPNKEKFIGSRYVAVKDCVKNQIGDCSERNKVSSPPLFPGLTVRQVKADRPSIDTLLELKEEIPNYERCIDCSAFNRNPWGTVWLRKKRYPRVLTPDEAYEKTLRVLGTNRNFRLDTYVNGQCTVTKMENRLEEWGDWKPELILIDYMDLIVAEIGGEYRHQQNEIWKRVRGMSQKTNAAVCAPTQADAKAYKQGLLTLDNFSEDKRKYAHATAFIGMNQDPDGIEKQLGIMRFNKLLSRDDDFNHRKVVHVIQDLRVGKPIVDSYW